MKVKKLPECKTTHRWEGGMGWDGMNGGFMDNTFALGF
jgi:hypothetical protein